MAPIISVREKLHAYIEQAGEDKLNAIYTLVSDEIEYRDELYDEETLKSLHQIGEDYFAGKIKGYSIEESMARLSKPASER